MSRVTEAQRRASAKYKKANTTKKYIELNARTDSDIIAHLSTVPNFAGYVKALIRNDMKITT